VGAFTSRFSLYKPGGGSTGLIVPDEILDIDKLNSNFDIIDANLGAFIATSTTLPGVPKVGQLVFETDTKRLRVYSGGSFVAPATERGSLTMYTGTNLAALDAITDGVVGDTFYMTDPGLGNAGTGTIDPMTWEAIGDSGVNLNWRVRDLVVADTKAHLDTFIAAVAAIAGTDAEFRIGNLAFPKDTQVPLRFTSIAGAYVVAPAYVDLIPVGVASVGAASVDGTGLLTVTGLVTGATLRVNCDKATLALFKRVHFIIDCEAQTAAATQQYALQLANGATILSAAASYVIQGVLTTAGANNVFAPAAATSWSALAPRLRSAMRYIFKNLPVTKETTAEVTGNAHDALLANLTALNGGTFGQVTTAAADCDGVQATFTISAGNATATVRVVGEL
jgi:hypothetical protein